jgi:probable F420-dependent oxidoreductase
VTSPKPFRFSLQISNVSSHAEWVDLVRRAEGNGFDLVVTADHIGGCLSPLVALASAAEAAERIRLGSLVLNNDFYHPVLLARDMASLDFLSRGRVELGLGAGHTKPEYQRAGISFDPASQRIDRLEEAVLILRRLFAGESVTRRGRHYQIVDQVCDPRPVQDHLPLLVGGGGTRLLSMAARLADAVGFTGLGRTLADGQRHDPSGFPPACVDSQVQAVRRAARERLSEIELQALVQTVVLTDQPISAARDLVAKRLPTLSADDVLSTPYLMVGSRASITDQLLAYRERWGFTHYTVRLESLKAAAPIVSDLAGR